MSSAPPYAIRHFTPSSYTRRYDGYKAPAPSSGPSAPGESFVKNGIRYYWFVSHGRKFYTSHPHPGMTPATGPGQPIPKTYGIPILGVPIPPNEQATEHARREKAFARLRATEQRVAHFQKKSQRRIIRRAKKLR